MPEQTHLKKWGLGPILFFIIAPLLLGSIAAAFIPQPIIGLIELRDPIDNNSGAALTAQIQHAYTNNRIKAVVLIIDCPGGTINDTELVFMELNRLRAKKPVVSMVQGLSASGAYYISMATDAIVSNPSAMVGNVGVIGQLPESPIIYEDTISTGPYKLWGRPGDKYIRQIEVMKKSFIQAVVNGRGDALQLSAEEISRGEVYPASEALKLGLIDVLGPQSAAIELAAQKARVAHYRTAYIDYLLFLEYEENDGFFALDENGESTGFPKEPGFYYLYIPEIKGGLR